MPDLRDLDGIEPIVRRHGDLGIEPVQPARSAETLSRYWPARSLVICCHCSVCQTLVGRNFTAEDDQQDTVILGYGIWQRWFGGQPEIIGKTIDLSGTTYTVIGVTPAWFRFPTSEFQLWAPLSQIDRMAPEQAKNRAFRIFSAVTRLKPGVTKNRLSRRSGRSENGSPVNTRRPTRG